MLSFIGDGDMVTQEDTIFVAGMNPQTTENDIADHFGAIGIIKVRFRSAIALRSLVCTKVQAI